MRPPLSNQIPNKSLPIKSKTIVTKSTDNNSKNLGKEYSEKIKIKNQSGIQKTPILHTQESISKRTIDCSTLWNYTRNNNKNLNNDNFQKTSENNIKSSYNVFFEHTPENKILQDFTKKKKSTKKQYLNKNNSNIPIKEDTSDILFKHVKKVFPSRLKSNINYINNYTIENDFTPREHIIDNHGDIMTTKKHFTPQKPSIDITRFNDKKNMLPKDYCEKHSKPYTRASSLVETTHNTNAADCLVNVSDKSNVRSRLRHSSVDEQRLNISKYPYVKDNMKDILMINIKPLKEYKLTPNINKNPFDILNYVPKYDWEKEK